MLHELTNGCLLDKTGHQFWYEKSQCTNAANNEHGHLRQNS
jgi:hypothetical protein